MLRCIYVERPMRPFDDRAGTNREARKRGTLDVRTTRTGNQEEQGWNAWWAGHCWCFADEVQILYLCSSQGSELSEARLAVQKFPHVLRFDCALLGHLGSGVCRHH